MWVALPLRCAQEAQPRLGRDASMLLERQRTHERPLCETGLLLLCCRAGRSPLMCQISEQQRTE